MPAIAMHLNGDGCWPDLKDREYLFFDDAKVKLSIARLPQGMNTGNSSVTIRIDDARPDGQPILVQTSMRLFQLVAKSFLEADLADGIDNA